MTPREQANATARLAAYGAADVRTPADYKLLEALQEMRKSGGIQAPKKRKRYERIVEVVDEAVEPKFEEIME